MAFFPDSSIFRQGVDDMLFNSAASSMHTESTSSAPFPDAHQYFSPTGEISFSPPSIVDNAFIFGDPMFHSDFNPDITNEFSYLNLYSPSFDSVAEPVDAFVSYSASPSLPHIEGTDEDAEFDLDPEYDSNSGGNGDSMEYDSETVNASTATPASSPSSEYRDWSPSSSSSDPCTVVDSGDDTLNPFAEDSSDTCCSDNDESDYDEPDAGSRKRARTSKTDRKSTSKSPKSKRGKKANFEESSERWPFHDLPVKVRCIERTCDVVLWSINSAVDHFNETHVFNGSVRCAYSDCDMTAKSVGDMRRHFLKREHQPSHFTCNSCHTTFTRRDAMLRHVRNMKGRCKNRPMRKVPAKRAPADKAVKKGRARKAKA
ncbi:hypothetical protein EDD85DRAFT_953641 [Armillaria nabsnona]|nr:hypothetical protein EDD85DRAFT_953641 [Armillaria nabsnona]